MWERLSYFITAVAAVLGWLITHYVDRVTKTPTIEYVIDEQGGPIGRTVVYELTNLSRTDAYGPVHVAFNAGGGTRITGLDVRPIEPADEGKDPVIVDPEGRYATFELPKMMPGGGFRFRASVVGPQRPRLYLDAGRPVRFTKRGFDTWLARYETEVVVGLILFWGAVLLALVGLPLLASPSRRAIRRLRRKSGHGRK